MAQVHPEALPVSLLTIRLLGDFYLELDGEPLRTVNTARLQAVLAYLLLHRHAPQPRQHMAFQFWPDSPEGQALNNLRKALHELRNALPQGCRCV
jgi:DNA-binding SARP family transcriptional activator